MEVITVFDERGLQGKFYISSWYCKPVILESLAYRLRNGFYHSLLFIACSKYGCRQFLPEFHKSFPVHNLYWETYKSSCDWCVIEFNDNAR